MTLIRRMLTMGFCALTLVGCASETAMKLTEPQKIRLNVFRVDAATVVGQVKGVFAEEKLEIETSITPNSTEQMRGLSQGKYEMVSTAFDNVLAWSGREGAELVAVGQISDYTVLPIFVRPEIKTWSDLKGKKLAADAVDTAFALALRRVLLANGLDMTKGDYELVAAGATGARLDSMVKGETFAAVLNPPVDAKALAAGMRRIGDSKAALPDYPNTIFAVNRAWGQNNRAAIHAYLRAWLKSAAWVRDPANRAEAIKIVGAQLKLNPNQATEAVDEISATGELNLKGLQTVLDLRNMFGFKLNKGEKLPAYYDRQYIDAVKGK